MGEAVAEERRQPLLGLDNRVDAWEPFQVVEGSLPVHIVFLVRILVVVSPAAPSQGVPFQAVPSLVAASQAVPFLVAASQAVPSLAAASLVGTCLVGAYQVVPFQAGVAFQVAASLVAAASQGEEEVEAATLPVKLEERQIVPLQSSRSKELCT